MDTTLIHNIVMFLTLKKTNQINIILLQYFNTKKVFKTHFPYFHMILNYWMGKQATWETYIVICSQKASWRIVACVDDL